MKSFRSYALIALSTIFVLVGGGLRATNLDQFQHIHADELIWVLSGSSLLQTGVPKSWTVFWDVYGSSDVEIIDGREVGIAKPFLDHPPVFQLLMGSWAVATGNVGSGEFN